MSWREIANDTDYYDGGPDYPSAREIANERARCVECERFVSNERAREHSERPLDDYTDGPSCPPGKGCAAGARHPRVSGDDETGGAA